MEKDPNILAEISEISPLLASLKNKNVFSVPDGYFDSLPSLITDRVQTFSFDEGKKPVTPQFAVPTGYFESLSSSILSKIKEERDTEVDEANAYPVLAGIKNKGDAMTVPTGYFENLPGQILEKVQKPAAVAPISGSKIVPLYRKPVFRYAIAAAVIVLLLAGIFFRFDGVQQADSFAVVNKKTVPEKAALKYNSEKSFEEGIASLSDDQIIAYLQNHGNISDNFQLISNTNVSKMPDPLDYLVDEKALENYLRGISN